MLSGSRIAVVNVPEDALVLRPPDPSEPIADVGSAVRDALRFPLSGAPLEALVTAGGKATIVVEPPELPLPGAESDPRRAALAATIAELERLGVPSRQQTILVAGGLNRRAGQRELEALVSPPSARRFHGHVEVHDAEAPDLVHLADAGRTPLRVNRLVAETDLVVCVTAAETVLHGGPGLCVGACGAETLRASTAYSLLETAAARGWQLGLALERALAARVPVIGASLVLNPPRLQGPLPRLSVRGRVARAARDLAASPLLAPPFGLRRRILDDLGRELTAVAAFAGPPSVAHAEALLRGIARRCDPAGAAARRPRDRHAVEASPLAAGTVEPDHGRDRRARPRAAALARCLPGRRGRYRDRAPPALAPLPARNAGSIPLALPRAPRRPHDVGARDRGAGSGDGRARPRRLPGRPRLPSAAALRGLGELQARARPARRRRGGGLPRPPGRAHARVRAHARAPDSARDGTRPCGRRGADRLRPRPALLPARGRRRARELQSSPR